MYIFIYTFTFPTIIKPTSLRPREFSLGFWVDQKFSAECAGGKKPQTAEFLGTWDALGMGPGYRGDGWWDALECWSDTVLLWWFQVIIFL